MIPVFSLNYMKIISDQLIIEFGDQMFSDFSILVCSFQCLECTLIIKRPDMGRRIGENKQNRRRKMKNNKSKISKMMVFIRIDLGWPLIPANP